MNMNKAAKTRQKRVCRVWVRQLLLMFSVIGPGLITANVDNDATGITGYSLAGANYGHADRSCATLLEEPPWTASSGKEVIYGSSLCSR